jgi:integrase
LQDYRSALNAHLLPAFAEQPLESITTEDIERWRRSLTGLSNRSKNKLLIQLHGIFRRAQQVWGLPVNPLARVEKHPMRPSGDIQVFSPEEVWALVRAAASEQDGTLFLAAAFTGLRMGELLALCWRDVDFAGATVRVRASWAGGQLTTPKSGKVRAVPMAPGVPRRWRDSVTASAGPAATSWCSPASSARTWTGRLCAGAMGPR